MTKEKEKDKRKITTKHGKQSILEILKQRPEKTKTMMIATSRNYQFVTLPSYEG